MKIGIYGGTFNPIHNGHLIIAKWVKNEYKLDKIIFVPNNKSPFKNKNLSVTNEQRKKMIELAIVDYDNFEINDYELNKSGDSYTIDTLNHIISSKNDYYFIMGSDSLKFFHKWKCYSQILKLVKIICVDRKDELDCKYEKVLFSNMPFNYISSTLIRDRIENNINVEDLLPKKVLNYIKRERLYEKKEDKKNN